LWSVLLVEETGVPEKTTWGRRGRNRDRMVVEYTTTCAISAYHH
jgi:hypothetical protein